MGDTNTSFRPTPLPPSPCHLQRRGTLWLRGGSKAFKLPPPPRMDSQALPNIPEGPQEEGEEQRCGCTLDSPSRFAPGCSGLRKPSTPHACPYGSNTGCEHHAGCDWKPMDSRAHCNAWNQKHCETRIFIPDLATAQPCTCSLGP